MTNGVFLLQLYHYLNHYNSFLFLHYFYIHQTLMELSFFRRFLFIYIYIYILIAGVGSWGCLEQDLTKFCSDFRLIFFGEGYVVLLLYCVVLLFIFYFSCFISFFLSFFLFWHYPICYHYSSIWGRLGRGT